MFKKLFFTVSFILLAFAVCVYAQATTYIVVSGDTLWGIAVKNQIGISELIAANTQLKNPSLIYPGEKLTVPSASDTKAIESDIVRLVNIERSKRGLNLLTENWQLSRIARYKSQDMIDKNYFSHTSPTYGSPFQMIESFKIRFSAAGENIAYGQPTAQAVMTAWMNSPGHRANILSPAYTQIGVGLAKSKTGVCYWTQQFIKPY